MGNYIFKMLFAIHIYFIKRLQTYSSFRLPYCELDENTYICSINTKKYEKTILISCSINTLRLA